MGISTTKAITTVKKELRLNEWAEQIQERKQSGLNVQDWCKQNGISPKTYYYRLRRVREECVEPAPAIVPVSVPKQNGGIHIAKNDLQISLPTDISPDVLLALVRELC